VMAENNRSGPGDRRKNWRGGRRAPDHRQRPIVLVVDDHADSREVIAAVLGAADIATAEASSGRTALQRILEVPRPSAVIIDLGLPDCHGTDLIMTLRQAPENADLPILVLSASVTDADRSGAAAAGASAFLRKPILPDDLLIALREALARTA
jgi:two-component system KDP operon response regulator KdpE